MSLNPDSDDQFTLASFESDSLTPSSWEVWFFQVQQLLGHSGDGNQDTDGYSIDGFYQLWLEGSLPAEAIREVGSIEFRS